MISHGIAGFLKERLFGEWGCFASANGQLTPGSDSSDAFRIHVCDQCGLMAIANLKKQEFYCSVCRNSTQISQVYIPYAAKVSVQSRLLLSGGAWRV